MKDFTITTEQIIALRIAHRGAKKKRDADRIKSIYLLGTGWSFEEVTEILMLDEETLRNYIRRYEKGGVQELIAYYYKGSSPKLSKEELLKLDEHLQKNTYLTVDAMIIYIKEK